MTPATAVPPPVPLEQDAWARAELSRFMRSCRARLRPRDVGLPSQGVRRVAGLRREEVAELADVSPTWYTSFELRGAARVSARFIATIASALRLSETERAFLFALSRTPTAAPNAVHGPDTAQRALTDREGETAIALLDGGLRLLSANALFRRLFRVRRAARADPTHLLRRIFADRAIREFVEDWETLAALTCGALRMQLARADAGAVEAFAALRDDPEFGRWWADAGIVDPRNAEHDVTVQHPRVGRIRLHASAIGIADSSTIVLVIVPADDRAARALARL